MERAAVRFGSARLGRVGTESQERLEAAQETQRLDCVRTGTVVRAGDGSDKNTFLCVKV